MRSFMLYTRNQIFFLFLFLFYIDELGSPSFRIQNR
jgi:hypothetical protein